MLDFPDWMVVNTKADGSGTKIKPRQMLSGLTNGETLYVEVIDPSPPDMTIGTISARFSIQQGGAVALPVNPQATLDVTPFSILGPNDVPQFGKYEYTASYSSGWTGPAGSGWQYAQGGGMAITSIPIPKPWDAFISWGAGPAFGLADYKATANYI